MLLAHAVTDVRAAEERAREDLEPGELMLRAARGLAEVVALRARQQEAARLVVLAGPGDNGGDALYAASMLAAELPVEVVGVGERLHAPALEAARRAGVPIHLLETDASLEAGESAPVREVLAEADLVVDGLLGIGGRPGLRGAMAAVVEAVPESAYLIAVDLPSGADPAGTEPAVECVYADETVTFGMLKPVHLLPGTEAAVGRLTVVDIGVPTEAVPVSVERLEHTDVARLWPVPGPRDHKYSRGVVGVVAGSAAYPGAAVLCSTSAVAAGAGMVRYLGPRRAEDLVLAASPEIVPGEGRVQAWALGPGVAEDDPDQPERIRSALAQDVPAVVDAGALALLPEWLSAGGRRDAPTLLTPHAGELATLLTALEDAEVDRAAVEDDPVGHARRAAEATGCVVLLKGSTTLVVAPGDGVPVRAQADAPAWLATAGAGDVLAGLCGMLLAAGLDPRDAGALAALVHGVAADDANPGGPVRALEVARALPRTVARLLRLP